MSERSAADEATVREIVRRIRKLAQPERIIVFGSAAREEMGPNSDVDVLVVKSGVHRRKLAADIYAALTGVGRAVDVVVVTPEDIERFGTSPGTILLPALREGRVVHGD